ncbi:hypothetical protein OROHE_004991 [Orobanche hederae]
MAAPEEDIISYKPETAEPPPFVEVKSKVEPPPPPPPLDDDSKALAKVEQGSKKPKESLDRDIALAKLEYEKKLSFIKAWEEREKSKVENKAEKRHSKVTSWENSKKASLEAQLKQIQEQLERKKAEHAEKMKNKEALIHKRAEEKRAIVEAEKGELILKTEQMAAKYRATGQVPKTGLRFF